MRAHTHVHMHTYTHTRIYIYIYIPIGMERRALAMRKEANILIRGEMTKEKILGEQKAGTEGSVNSRGGWQASQCTQIPDTVGPRTK